MISVRFERGQNDNVSSVYGPFPFVQLTYEELRVGPEGLTLAIYFNGWWKIQRGGDEGLQNWSDVVIASSESYADEVQMSFPTQEQTT
jgi:hypothetical protein